MRWWGNVISSINRSRFALFCGEIPANSEPNWSWARANKNTIQLARSVMTMFMCLSVQSCGCLIPHSNNAIGICERRRFGSHNCVTENSLHINVSVSYASRNISSKVMSVWASLKTEWKQIWSSLCVQGSVLKSTSKGKSSWTWSFKRLQ